MANGNTDEAPRLIMVVEDEPVMNELVSEILRFHGFATCSVMTGEEALEACDRRVPDAILLDIMLPGISGYEVCHQLKCARRTNMVPIIMLSALDRRDDQVRGIRVGADAYLTKPFEPDSLVTAIAATIDQVAERVAAGQREHIQLSFQSDMEYLDEVNHLLLSLYSQTPLSEEDIQKIHYCLLELGRNAIEWGNRNKKDLLIHMQYTLGPESLEFRISDQGEGFNPANLPHAADGKDPLAHTFIREKLGLRDGGFGILLSKHFMDEIVYNEKGNEVRLVKRFRKAGQSAESATPAQS